MFHFVNRHPRLPQLWAATCRFSSIHHSPQCRRSSRVSTRAAGSDGCAAVPGAAKETNRCGTGLYELAVGGGFFVPAGPPPAVIQKLNQQGLSRRYRIRKLARGTLSRSGARNYR